MDILLMTDPTHVFIGKLKREKIAWQANPDKNAHDEPEPVVSAWVRISPINDDIPEDSRVPVSLARHRHRGPLAHPLRQPRHGLFAALRRVGVHVREGDFLPVAVSHCIPLAG